MRLLLMLLFAFPAYAADDPWADFPKQQDEQACLYLVDLLGPVIYQLRTELHLTREQAHDTLKTNSNAPQWVVRLAHQWTDVAYSAGGKEDYVRRIRFGCRLTEG